MNHESRIKNHETGEQPKAIQNSELIIHNSKEGQSLVEVLVSLGIFALVTTAVFLLMFGGQSISLDSSSAQNANEYAVEAIEAVNSIKERDWLELIDGDHGLVFLSGEWYFASGTTDTREIFTRTVNIETIDSDTKKASTTITWQTDPLRVQMIDVVTVVTNWISFLDESEDQGGDDGGTGTEGDWMFPTTLSTVDVDAGGQATDLDVLNGIVCLTSSFADPKKPDLYIFDATVPTTTTQVASLDVGDSLNSLDTAFTYAFGASDDKNNQLQIIDVSTPSSPSVLTTFKLPGVSGNGAIGNSIFFYANRIYMGTKAATGPEFHIIDVSNPASPSSLGSLELGEDINKIHVRDDLAYLATDADSAELQIYDISDPGSITLVGSYDAAGTEAGKSIYLAAATTTLYLGKLEESSNDELYMLDISDPASIQFLGSEEISADINDLTVRDALAFLATSEAGSEFQAWDISDPANISLWSSFNFPQVATGIDYENNTIYVSVRSNDALRIITSQ